MYQLIISKPRNNLERIPVTVARPYNVPSKALYLVDLDTICG